MTRVTVCEVHGCPEIIEQGGSGRCPDHENDVECTHPFGGRWVPNDVGLEDYRCRRCNARIPERP